MRTSGATVAFAILALEANVMSTSTYPVRVDADLDPGLNRWLRLHS
jgi:hypothetical protein